MLSTHNFRYRNRGVYKSSHSGGDKRKEKEQAVFKCFCARALLFYHEIATHPETTSSLSISLRKTLLSEKFRKTARFIYSIVITYSMATTISLSVDMKEKLKNLGKAGDSYEDVIRKMYELTRKNILASYLYDESDSISLEKARKRI